jgi:hypothetical protein
VAKARPRESKDRRIPHSQGRAYIEQLAPERAGRREHWHSNDGDGPDAEDSESLAVILDGEIAGDRCAEFVQAFELHQRTVQDEPCEVCDGTGFRVPPPDLGPGDQFCNACDGLGQSLATIRNYRLTVEAVKGFAAFLHDCGGFTID